MSAFVAFASAHPELLDLMFARKRASGDPASELDLAADRALGHVSCLIDEATSAAVAPAEATRQWYLLAALTLGIAAPVSLAISRPARSRP